MRIEAQVGYEDLREWNNMSDSMDLDVDGGLAENSREEKNQMYVIKMFRKYQISTIT